MIVNVFVNDGHRIPIESDTNHANDIAAAISRTLNQSTAEFYLIQNGKLVQNNNNDAINIDAGKICVCWRLVGGKGGFGSMLRAIGAQIEKTTNREACRDLSGRRLRDINEEKRLKEYLEKQKDNQEDEAAKIARKIERLRSKPKHEFKDDEYFETRSNLLDDVSNALEDGLKKSGATSSTAATTSAVSSGSNSNSGTDNDHDTDQAGGSGIKRKNSNDDKNQKKKKKKKNVKGALWLDEGLSSDGSSDSDDDSSSNDTKSKS